MSDEETEFRESVRRAIRAHDPSAEQLRQLSDDLVALAEKFDATEETI